MCRYAPAKVATVSGARTRSPSPKRPIGPSYTAASTASHCASNARVGTRQRQGARVAAMTASATCVLPLPVGSATTPRRPARRQAASAASW